MPKARPSSRERAHPAATEAASAAGNAIRADGLITTGQAAQLCGVKQPTIHAWLSRELVPAASRDGRRVLMNLLDVIKADMITRRHSGRAAAPDPTWTVDGAPDVAITAILAACRAVAEQELATETAASVVYYIQFGDRIKIGTSCRLMSRLSDLPHDALLATEPGGRNVETMRHGQFAAWRVTGEWFRAAGPLLEHIATLQLTA